MGSFINGALYAADYVITALAGMLLFLLLSLNIPVILGYYLLQIVGIKFDVIKNLKKRQLILLLLVCSFYSICVYIGIYRIKYLFF